MGFIGAFGYRPDTKKDFRDYKLSIVVPKILPLRSSVEKWAPPVFDQLNFGSCVFNAWMGIYGSLMFKHGVPFIRASRMFPYWNVRWDYLQQGIISSISEDCGAEIRDGGLSFKKLGSPHESTWLYTAENFAKKPNAKAYAEALLHQGLRMEKLDDANRMQQIKACIANSRVPVVFGFNVYASFENIGPDGIMPMPKSYEEYLGGHAVYIIAYDDKLKRFKVRNSWGPDWGDKGNFYMPYDFAADTDECMDFWRMTSAEGA